MADDLAIPFVRSRYFNTTNGRKIDLVVIHDMEAPEEPDTAENVARWFAGTTSPQASAHYLVDNNSIVQGVLDKDIAWHAPGANSNGLGIEHAGYAAQRADQWADAYSTAELELSAKLTRQLCDRNGIPVQFVDAATLLKGGARGITTHWEVTKAWHKTDHTDPGPNFPTSHYIDLVRGTASTEVPAVKEVRLQVNAPLVTVISHPSWNGGYIEIGADGGTFSFGAPNFGSLGNIKLNAPVVGAAATPSGQGYWLVGADGGVFAFGDAKEFGSEGGQQLNKPVVGICPTGDGGGYWLVAQDGGLFSFGNAAYKGGVVWNG